MILELVRERIPCESLLARITGPDCGAVVSFQGVVRDHHHGRQVLRLEYTAYEPMARQEMGRLSEEIRQRWPVKDLLIVHRLGVLEIGETSILIGLALAHRKEGFEALRFAIDTFKDQVPIWKKETFADGVSEWVEGS